MPNKCSLCRNKIISEDVLYDGTTLIVILPEQIYENKNVYCIVIAQKIPDDVLIKSDVAFIIGKDDKNLYPFLNCDCSKVTACSVRTRTMYRTQLVTSDVGGAFRFMGRLNCGPNYDLPFIGNKPLTKKTNKKGLKQGDDE